MLINIWDFGLENRRGDQRRSQFRWSCLIVTMEPSPVDVTGEPRAILVDTGGPLKQRRHAVFIRMRPATRETNPRQGTVVWSPVKSLWFTFHFVVAIVGGYFTFRPDAAAFSFALTVVTLCLGHTIGLHRLLIHRSFECFRLLEYLLVHLGTVVGMGGPFRMLYAHDIRDWAQRHSECHPFFFDSRPVWRDLWWQLHCELRLAHPPEFVIEEDVAGDRVYRFMQRT